MMPEPLSDEYTLKWCEGCPLDKRHNMETLDCGAYKLRWPRWDGEQCPARETAETRAQTIFCRGKSPQQSFQFFRPRAEYHIAMSACYAAAISPSEP